MTKKESPTPTKGRRASCVSFGDWTQVSLTLATCRAQCLIYKYGIRPELAAVFATAVFGEGGGNG